jgi:nucleotidyltransferase/DNA polymerase involved in DNA repair
MNTFFVSVERLKDPALEGQPVVVGGEPGGRSVVSSASYEARRYGIHSAMPMSEAVRRCPELIIVRPGFSDYQHFHKQVKAILADFTPALEMTSIDEGYLDLTGTEQLWGPPPDAGRRIRERILQETALPSSIGISSNKLVSKVASDLAKPAGDPRKGDTPAIGKSARHTEPASRDFSPAGGGERSLRIEVRRPGPLGHESKGVAPNLSPARHHLITSEGVLVVPNGQEAAFLAPLPISHLPGCGKKTIPRLHAVGLHTVGDLAARVEEELTAMFGEMGRMLWRRANGRGSRSLETGHQRKSISKERTFAEDVADETRLRAVLHKLTEGVTDLLRRRCELARTVTLKLRYDDFETHTFSHTLPEPADLTPVIFHTAAELLDKRWSRKRPLRLIGMGISNLMKSRPQEDLFSQQDQAAATRRTAAIDDIRERFGKDSLLTGESVNLLKREGD